MSVPFDGAAYRGAKIVVLGGTGFIGTHVVDGLIRFGATPILLCRSKPSLPARWKDRVAVYDEPIGTLKAVQEAIATCFAFNEAAGVINLAAAGVLPDRRDPNVLNAANGVLAETIATSVADLSAELPAAWGGLALLHVGSALEYGRRPTSLDEGSVARPDEPYGKSKLRGSLAVVRARDERGLPALVARPFGVFGRGEQSGRLLPTLIARCADDAPIELTHGEQFRDFAAVEDVAAAILELAASPRAAVVAKEGPFDAGVVNVATGRPTRVRDFVLAAAKEFLIEESRLRFGALPPREDETDHPPTPVKRLAAACGGRLPEGDPTAGLRRLHRSLLASLYEVKPKDDERRGAPKEPRPPQGRERDDARPGRRPRRGSGGGSSAPRREGPQTTP